MLNIPLTFIEENHLDELRGLRILFMPRVLVIDDHTAEALSEFVRGGGTLVCESECGAFTSQGLYRSPEERFLARLTGIQEMGRRSLEGDSLSIRLDGRSVDIPASQWLTPLVEGKGEVLARYSEGPLVVKADVGKGKVILCGTYSGQSYYQGSFHGAKPYAGTCPGFEQFVEFLVRQAGVQTMVRIMEAGVAGAPFVQVATGVSGSRRLAFVFSADADPVRLRFRRGFFRGPVTDLIQGGPVAVSETPEFQECRVADTAWGVAVLAG
jgi:beta-galactosidase